MPSNHKQSAQQRALEQEHPPPSAPHSLLCCSRAWPASSPVPSIGAYPSWLWIPRCPCLWALQCHLVSHLEDDTPLQFCPEENGFPFSLIIFLLTERYLKVDEIPSLSHFPLNVCQQDPNMLSVLGGGRVSQEKSATAPLMWQSPRKQLKEAVWGSIHHQGAEQLCCGENGEAGHSALPAGKQTNQHTAPLCFLFSQRLQRTRWWDPCTGFFSPCLTLWKHPHRHARGVCSINWRSRPTATLVLHPLGTLGETHP